MKANMINHSVKRAWLLVLMMALSMPASAFQVLALGDSITQGYQRDAAGNIYAFPNPLNGAANIGGYLPRLKGLLDNNYSNSDIYNWGIGGERSDGGLFRIQSVINTRPNADYILIMYGANDLYAGISSSATSANIAAMIDISRSRNVVPIVSEITPNFLFGNAIAADYNVRIKAVADSKNVFLAKNYQRLVGGWFTVPYHSGDQLHLSNAGYHLMSDEWFYRIRDHRNYLRELELQQLERSLIPVRTLLLLDE